MIDWLPSLLSEIVNTASSPSSTVTSPMVTSPRTSSSLMVPVAAARNEFSALSVRVTLNVSVGSGVVSSLVSTVIVCEPPGLSTRVPDAGE